MQTTANYGLKKPEGNDTVDIDVINENMDTIDTKLKNNEDSMGNLQGNVNSHLADTAKHIGYAVTTNSGNAYSAAIPNLTALTDGLQIRLKFNVTATGAITLNINNLGAKNVYDYYGNKVSDIHGGFIANLAYNAVDGNFILQGKGGGGNATSADLLSGKTATVDGGQITGSMESKLWGTMANNTQVWSDNGNIKLAYRIPLGAYLDNGNGDKTNCEVNAIENSLISDNIKSGKTIFGVSGKNSVVDTADATATADKILSGYSAYVNGSKVNGNATLESLGGKRYFEGNVNTDSNGQSDQINIGFIPSIIKITIPGYNYPCVSTDNYTVAEMHGMLTSWTIFFCNTNFSINTRNNVMNKTLSVKAWE